MPAGDVVSSDGQKTSIISHQHPSEEEFEEFSDDHYNTDSDEDEQATEESITATNLKSEDDNDDDLTNVIEDRRLKRPASSQDVSLWF